MKELLGKLRQLRLLRAAAFVWRGSPRWLVVNTILSFIQGFLPLITLLLMGKVVDAVSGGLKAADKDAAFDTVVFFILLTGVAMLVNLLCRMFSSVASEAQGMEVTDYMQAIVHAKSVEADLEYYENPKYFDVLHRAQREAPGRPMKIVNGLTSLARAGISLTAVTVLLFLCHWSIVLILLAAVIPGVIVRLRTSGVMYRWQRKRTSTERHAQYFNWILTDSQYAQEVRLLGLGPLIIERYRALRKLLRVERFRLSLKRGIFETGAQLIASIAILSLLAYIARRAIIGEITLGQMVVYYGAFQRGQGFLRETLSAVAGLYEDNLFLTNLYEFLEMEPKVIQPASPKPVPRPMRQGLEFDRVGFKYPGGKRQVLENVSFKIAPGEHVAFVGENGSGKTTAIKLLCRLYDPTSGSIRIDGVDLREMDVHDLRREIGVIFQNYARYHLTARENIAFGNIEAPEGDPRVIEASREAGAHEAISRLSNGYDTMLGKWFEDGEELSVGEWQKVALARAFMRKSGLIVLDEPTSSMDARAEFEFFERFRQLAEGRSAILISHRFSTVRMADRIFVIENGRIAENGSHDELMRINGLYARLFNMQARYYQDSPAAGRSVEERTRFH